MPPAMVGLSLCSAAMPDVSSDSLFIALELRALKTWLVRLAKESVCKVIDCSSHVKACSHQTGGKVEKRQCEEMGQDTFLEKRHDAERDIVVLKNLSRDKEFVNLLRVESGHYFVSSLSQSCVVCVVIGKLREVAAM